MLVSPTSGGVVSVPRLLVLIGSGETSRMAAAVYREVRSRFPFPPTVRLLDTTYAFQENRHQITARLTALLSDHLDDHARPAGAGAASEVMRWASIQTDLEDADVVLAGPGSPSYALRQWAGTSIPDVLAAKLERGGVLVLASAGACTAGARALPIYEIYKAGHDPTWLSGLDLTRTADLDVAVIPHFDNAEGGNHDTRYCYMGEHRLRQLEAQLPPSTAVLGVDEHTAAILDLDADTVTVHGRGAVTLRRRGAVNRVLLGGTAPLDELRSAGTATGNVRGTRPARPRDAATAPTSTNGRARGIASLTVAVHTALDRGDAEACLVALLELDRRSRDSTTASERNAARLGLHAGITRLARAAATRWHDERHVIAPLVESVLAVRQEARQKGQFTRADWLRDQLHAAGIVVRDTPDGPVWVHDPSTEADDDVGGRRASSTRPFA